MSKTGLHCPRRTILGKIKLYSPEKKCCECGSGAAGGWIRAVRMLLSATFPVSPALEWPPKLGVHPRLRWFLSIPQLQCNRHVEQQGCSSRHPPGLRDIINVLREEQLLSGPPQHAEAEQERFLLEQLVHMIPSCSFLSRDIGCASSPGKPHG